MNKKQILSTLTEYSDIEKTYKKLYENNIDSTNIGFLPHEFNDEELFKSLSGNSVLLLKHQRYTPLFEHSHNFFEGIYVYRGSCSNKVNGNLIKMEEGDFIILPPGTVHSIGVFDDSIIINMLIRRKTFEENFYDFIKSQNALSDFFTKNLYSESSLPYILFKTENNNLIKYNIMDMYRECICGDKYYEILLNQLIKVFFINLLRLPEEQIIIPHIQKKEYDKNIRMIYYIYENYRTVTLNDVAKYFHYSFPYTSKLIKEYTNMNFRDFIKKIKLEKAVEFLISTNIKISDIAYNLGYMNVENFIKIFKKTYNMTPSMYRTINSKTIN